MEELILILPQKVQKKDIVQHIKMAFEKESKVRYSTKLSISTPRDILTTKEMAILKLIAEGHQNKEIADKLNFSLNTIKKYVHKLYEKLGVKNRAEAVSWLNRVETSA